MSSVCDMLDDTDADSASLENNSSGLHESLYRYILVVYFSRKPIFLESQEKDSEKEQKQSLFKTGVCMCPQRSFEQKREQNPCCSLRAVEHGEQ